jgi:hypothetical protein
MNAAHSHKYRPTESKYKGGANEMYLTYDVARKTRSGASAPIPKVKRVYIAGEVEGWALGDFRKKSGRDVYGVKIDYRQTRRRYRREAFQAARGQTKYQVPSTGVRATNQHFSQIVELPQGARNVEFHQELKDLPESYFHALQDVR